MYGIHVSNFLFVNSTRNFIIILIIIIFVDISIFAAF